MRATNRRRLGLAVAGVVLLSGTACAPPRKIESSMNSYSTDIILGSQTKPEQPVPTPEAAQAPTFPSFFAPPPPAEPPAVAAPRPTPVTRPIVREECPSAGPDTTASAPTPDISRPPLEGTYPFRQLGTFSLNGKAQTPLPATAERKLLNLQSRTDGTFTIDVEVAQFGAVTTTTYERVRRFGQSDVDGIYITRIVRRETGKSPQEFLPVSPGLRIIPLPARVGQSFTSVATDPLRGTAVRLDGTVKEIGRVDACGLLVDGFLVTAKILTRLAGTPENERDITTDANYIVATQLGGLMIAEGARSTGMDRGATISQESAAVISSIMPNRK